MPAVKPSYPRLNRGHPLAASLVGAWPFYEGSGGQLHDVSGRDNHGTLMNMDPDTDWIGGLNASSLDFDGLNDWVNCGMNLVYPRASITVGGWYWIDSAGANHALLTQHVAAGNRNWMLQLLGATNRVAMNVYIGGVARTVISPVFTQDVWHFFVGTYDGAEVEVYIDGLPSGAPTPAAGIVDSHALATAIGSRSTGTVPFLGRCAQAFVYDHSLSPSEIQLLYHDSFCMFRPSGFVFPPPPPAGSIHNQFQRHNVGADLFDGALSV